MSIALVEHTGPWTPDDVEALPDLGVTRTTLTAGTRGRITRPFALELDPAQMIRRTSIAEL